MESKLVSYKDILLFNKEIIFLYKSKLKFEFIYYYIKLLNKEYLNDVDNFYKTFLENLSYEIKIKKQLINYLNKNYKKLKKDSYDMILEILNLLKSLQDINIKISNEIVNIIGSYYNNYNYISYNNFEDTKIYKLVIDEYIKNL